MEFVKFVFLKTDVKIFIWRAIIYIWLTIICNIILYYNYFILSKFVLRKEKVEKLTFVITFITKN